MITIDQVNKYESSKPLCVLGVLRTDAGIQIRDEMIKWICSKYNCICVNQDPPGELYEYPALNHARYLALNYNKPVLYLHTKGAGNHNHLQAKIRNMWKFEFLCKFQWYNDLNNQLSMVKTPFTGSDKWTWFNGFIATPLAYKSAHIEISSNRYDFEHIFSNCESVKVYGRILNNVSSESSKTPMLSIVESVFL